MICRLFCSLNIVLGFLFASLSLSLSLSLYVLCCLLKGLTDKNTFMGKNPGSPPGE